MAKIISGIQQVGIGIPNVYDAWKWYRQNLGFDVPVFDAPGTAELMLPYTGGEPQQRHAVLAINMQGGGGFEIWQYLSRTPKAADFTVMAGDLGIFAAKIKSKNVTAAYLSFKAKNNGLISNLLKDPAGNEHFFVTDPYGNIFQITAGDTWFGDTDALTGGAFGAVIGVSNMEKSIHFYKTILGFDKVIFDKTGNFDDFAALPGGKHTFRRVLLTHSEPRKGPFSNLLGSAQIELIQVTDRQPRKIYENRLWGDLGFIHLCFDIQGMADIKRECEENGVAFTVDSNPTSYESGQGTFDMGEAAGHFTYVEDPDGALIEFVETHKLPILKKLGWYLNLKKRDPEKALPNWMLKTLGFNRKKD